jgi:hypothetical protein
MHVSACILKAQQQLHLVVAFRTLPHMHAHQAAEVAAHMWLCMVAAITCPCVDPGAGPACGNTCSPKIAATVVVYPAAAAVLSLCCAWHGACAVFNLASCLQALCCKEAWVNCRGHKFVLSVTSKAVCTSSVFATQPATQIQGWV